MSSLSKMKAGDTIWVLERSYGRGPAKPPVEYAVVKMGREYFYAKPIGGVWPNDLKFRKDDGREWVGPNDNGAYRAIAYRHREEWENERHEAAVRAAIATYFRRHNAERKLTIAQAEQIAAILNVGPNAQTSPITPAQGIEVESPQPEGRGLGTDSPVAS